MYRFYTYDKWKARKANAFKLLIRVITGLFILVLTVSSKADAQQATNYTVQANIIYRFTKYIDWPDDRKSGDFIIGIVGETPLYDELKDFIEKKTAGYQKIVVKRFSSSAIAFNCHILFIDESESRSIKRITTVTAGRSILIVSESDGLAKKGSCINFSMTNDHLKLEINKNNIQERNLNIASELLQLGVIIK